MEGTLVSWCSVASQVNCSSQGHTLVLQCCPGERRVTQKYVTVRRPMPKTGNGSPNEAVIAHSTGVFRDTL